MRYNRAEQMCSSAQLQNAVQLVAVVGFVLLHLSMNSLSFRFTIYTTLNSANHQNISVRKQWMLLMDTPLVADGPFQLKEYNRESVQ